MSLGYWETLAVAEGDGTALTAIARASALQGAAKSGLFTLQPGLLRVRDMLHIRASGRVSFAVTTPGTFRLDLSFGVAGVAAFDTLAMPGNVVVQNTVPWSMEAWGTVRNAGNAGNMFWQGWVKSTAFLNTAAVATGPWTGDITIPYNTAPVIGANVDMTVVNILDFNFTQTVNTGSFTLHQYALSLLTRSGY